MEAGEAVEQWIVGYEDGDFILTHQEEDIELIVQTPLKLDTDFEAKNLPFDVHFFAKSGLRESQIHAVHLKGLGAHEEDPPRVGMLIPANALGSVEHDKADKKFFLQYSYIAIKLGLERLTRDSPELLEAFAAKPEPILVSDLFHDNTCFFVVSLSTLKDVEGFSIDRALPSLVSFGYVPLDACSPDDLSWEGNTLAIDSTRIPVRLVSSDVDGLQIVNRLITLSAISGQSSLTQFFYLYQVFEHLMESVMRHRLPILLRKMISDLEAGAASARDQYDILGDEIREKGRLKLLVDEYSQCDSPLNEFGVVAKDLLDTVNVDSGQGIDAVYKVRNFLFHQARNLPEEAEPLLAAVVKSFSLFLPSLLTTYKHPPQQEEKPKAA